jgi:AcrR family transcriptional regulator
MGAKYPKTNDRRVQRTRRTLREALVSLLLQRGWEGVSVQDICDRADVGRSTFYTHFADKEELLVGGFDDLRQALRAGSGPAPDAKAPLRFARGLIDHASENQRLFLALVGKRSGYVVLKRFRDMVVALVREDLAGLRGTGPARDAAVHYLAGGFLELLTWWLESRNSLSPEEVERLFLEMAAPAIELAGRG